MNISIDETILKQTIQLRNDHLRQQWHPCSKGLTIKDYFLMEQNGPFLRALCQTWQNLGSPKLEIVERIKSVYPFSEEGQLSSNGLIVLANSQEETIWKLVQELLKPDQTIKLTRTFEAFASQLNLFCMVKSELIQIERKRKGENHLHFYQVFQSVWQSNLEVFDQGRTFCSKQAFHSCIGNLIWGESFGVSLEMLKYSFRSYLIQENKKFESLRKFSLPYSFYKHPEPYNSQTHFYKVENNMKRRDACTPVQGENTLATVISEEIIRPSSPEEMIEDIDKDGDNNITNNSPIKWRKRLWTLTLTTPHRTYSIEISPKGTTALSRTEGILFPIEPVQVFNKEVNSLQLGNCNEIENESPQQILQNILAQLSELEYVFPCGTVTQISQQSTGE